MNHHECDGYGENIKNSCFSHNLGYQFNSRCTDNLPDSDGLCFIVRHRRSKIDIINPGNEDYNACQNDHRKDQYSATVDLKFFREMGI